MNTEFTKEQMALARSLGRLTYNVLGVKCDDDLSAMVCFGRMNGQDAALEQFCRTSFADYQPFSKTVEEKWKMIQGVFPEYVTDNMKIIHDNFNNEERKSDE